jgi:hypothetical protein
MRFLHAARQKGKSSTFTQKFTAQETVHIGARVKVHQFLLGVETMTRKIAIEQKWHRQSEAAKNEAERLPYGKEREDLLRKARQLDTASHINQWLSSPGLQPPT